MTIIRASLSIGLILLLGLLFLQCDSEPKQEKGESIDYKALILGNWTLKKAYRDKKESVGLANTFFEFKENGQMETNFNMEGKANVHKFIIENDTVKQEGAPAFDYHIYEVSDSSLTLVTKFRGFDFKLILEKWIKDSRD